MTPEEQNKAIAAALGKKYHKPTEEELASGSYYQYEPDFLNDLNAMHEAEKTLDDGREQLLLIKYQKILCDLCYDFPGTNVWHASASQRAEAFLKTIGKWKE